MNVELATNRDIETILDWISKWNLFDKHETPDLAKDTYVLKIDGKPVLACGMMTFEDNKYIRLYGMIKDPEAGSVAKEMTFLINHLCKIAEEMGYSFIQLFAPSEKLAKIYSSNGFEAHSGAMIPMIRRF
jgi:hypothetical protein